MQIVIDIDEDYYKIIKHDVDRGMDYQPYVLIANGIPLPKGHGRLIDVDALIFNADYNEPLISKKDFDLAPTVIEADVTDMNAGKKEEENGKD